MRALKNLVWDFWLMERVIRRHIRWARALYYHGGMPGRLLSALMDRWLFLRYGLDLYAQSIDVSQLSIAHPGGVLLGGNGIVSRGRVAIMAGVKFVGRSPTDPDFRARHAQRRVFVLGDNVVIGANSVVVGPVDICDNVVVSAMSLVNRSITEPGIYAGAPVRRVKDCPSDEWVAHLPRLDRET
jgi:serine acetyltransferase